MPPSPDRVSRASRVDASGPAAIPLSQPEVTNLERDYVLEVLQSTRLSFGPFLERFEASMAERCGTRHAVAISSGTAALHCIVRSLDLKPGDEVLTTPYSFVASANALLYENLKPVFVDIDPITYNIDVAKAKEAITPRTRGILAVDVFGTPANWPALTQLADEYDLALIDDACEAIGASVGGAPIGSWGDAASFGFYPNKQITTGEGGCITTDDADLAEMCRSLRNQGRATTAEMRHVRLGFNYRMSELQAALGCAQLDRLDHLLDRRERAAQRYHSALAPLEGLLTRPSAAPVGTRSWFVYVVQLSNKASEATRDKLVQDLRDRGIGAAPYFPSIHLQPFYRERFGYEPGTLPVAERVSSRTLALPFFPSITDAQIDRTAHVLSKQLPILLDA